MKLATATFGAGCFWSVEARFAALPGVVDTAAGYAGGTAPQPGYRDVCTGRTGHAEVVQVTYNPERVSYAELLDAFFAMHNPTQPYLGTQPTAARDCPDTNRSQYRSVIFAHTDEQREQALERIAELDRSGRWAQPVVTQVKPAPAFWRAEDYHQRYMERRNLRPAS
jgi:peptide-methionine (S)-S-oxide reductase